MIDDYALLDSGDGRKLERFGPCVLARPCAQALWRPRNPAAWAGTTASFDRDGGNRWHGRSSLPGEWTITTAGIRFRLSGTDFGHLGIFPEQRAQWGWIRSAVAAAGRGVRVLNLFAYSGGSTMAALQGGAETCHLDASKGMVQWARANAALNGLDSRPVRWIVDDAHKFLAREERRRSLYDAVILDPPTFGRGAGGEMYKIERDLKTTLSLVRAVLSPKPLFVLFSSHTPGISPAVAQNIMEDAFPESAGRDAGEMLLEGAPGAFDLPSGVWARAVWR